LRRVITRGNRRPAWGVYPGRTLHTPKPGRVRSAVLAGSARLSGLPFSLRGNVSLYWLTYSASDRVHGVVILQAADVVQARVRANMARLDQGAEFAAGYELDDEQAALVPEGMLGRMLSPHEAHTLIDRIERGIP